MLYYDLSLKLKMAPDLIKMNQETSLPLASISLSQLQSCSPALRKRKTGKWLETHGAFCSVRRTQLGVATGGDRREAQEDRTYYAERSQGKRQGTWRATEAEGRRRGQCQARGVTGVSAGRARLDRVTSVGLAGLNHFGGLWAIGVVPNCPASGSGMTKAE